LRQPRAFGVIPAQQLQGLSQFSIQIRPVPRKLTFRRKCLLGILFVAAIGNAGPLLVVV